MLEVEAAEGGVVSFTGKRGKLMIPSLMKGKS